MGGRHERPDHAVQWSTAFYGTHPRNGCRPCLPAGPLFAGWLFCLGAKAQRRNGMHSSLIGKIQKAHLYAEEPDRVIVNEFSATFRGDHSSYLVSYREGQW